MNKVCTLDDKILYICRCEYSYFLNKPNVIGVALGFKITKGVNTFKKCIKVFVTNKYSKNLLKKNDLIPCMFKGIKTDIDEIGVMYPLALRNRVRPVTGGYNISPTIGAPSGTLGCIVTDGKYYYLLSNAHILATNGDTPIGTDIVQPGRKYGGVAPKDTIANLTKYAPLQYSTPFDINPNFVDAAIAKITKRSQISTKITYLGRIKGIVEIRLGQKVQKVGTTTELTSGKIIGLGASVTIPDTKGDLFFQNQIMTTKIGDRGDSGSLLLDEDVNAIGLLMSASVSTCLCNHITDVLKSLNVRIVTG